MDPLMSVPTNSSKKRIRNIIHPPCIERKLLSFFIVINKCDDVITKIYLAKLYSLIVLSICKNYNNCFPSSASLFLSHSQNVLCMWAYLPLLTIFFLFFFFSSNIDEHQENMGNTLDHLGVPLVQVVVLSLVPILVLSVASVLLLSVVPVLVLENHSLACIERKSCRGLSVLPEIATFIYLWWSGQLNCGCFSWFWTSITMSNKNCQGIVIWIEIQSEDHDLHVKGDWIFG